MRIFLALALIFPFAAIADTAPRTYRAETPLIVRAKPTTAAETLGVLAKGATPVELTAEGDGWGRIAYQGADGWVAMAQLTPADTPKLKVAPLPVGLHCGGTEPFWSLAFTGPAEAVFTTPDTGPVSYSIPEGGPAEGRPEFPAILILNAVENAIALIRPLECSDGMSDMTYGWTLDLMTRRPDRALLLTGCCRLPISK